MCILNLYSLSCFQFLKISIRLPYTTFIEHDVVCFQKLTSGFLFFLAHTRSTVIMYDRSARITRYNLIICVYRYKARIILIITHWSWDKTYTILSTLYMNFIVIYLCIQCDSLNTLNVFSSIIQLFSMIIEIFKYTKESYFKIFGNFCTVLWIFQFIFFEWKLPFSTVNYLSGILFYKMLKSIRNHNSNE